MASMRRLNRRLLAWRRYAVKTHWNPRVTRPAWMSLDTAMTPGHFRAWEAQQDERQRRLDRAHGPYAGYGPCYCMGCIAHGRCDDDLGREDGNRCCNAGDDGHPGPCATTCLNCAGDGRCPDCDGIDDLGCDECGGSGSCGECWGEGEHVEDWQIGRSIVTVPDISTWGEPSATTSGTGPHEGGGTT